MKWDASRQFRGKGNELPNHEETSRKLQMHITNWKKLSEKVTPHMIPITWDTSEKTNPQRWQKYQWVARDSGGDRKEHRCFSSQDSHATPIEPQDSSRWGYFGKSDWDSSIWSLMPPFFELPMKFSESSEFQPFWYACASISFLFQFKFP